MIEVGKSLGRLCVAVDFLADGITAGTEWDCCSNADNLKTFCVERRFAGGQVTDAGAGVCESNDPSCQ